MCLNINCQIFPLLELYSWAFYTCLFQLLSFFFFRLSFFRFHIWSINNWVTYLYNNTCIVWNCDSKSSLYKITSYFNTSILSFNNLFDADYSNFLVVVRWRSISTNSIYWDINYSNGSLFSDKKKGTQTDALI